MSTVHLFALALNEERLRGKTQEEMLEHVLSRIDSLAASKPDMIVLPEIFLKTGGDTKNPRWAEISMQAREALAAKAKELHTYIAGTLYEPKGEGDWRYNTAFLWDRSGALAGKYRKQHTVDTETNISRVWPGDECPVFDTEFGKIGMQICFDIGWRKEWTRLAEQGARLVLWMAAYDGGSMLNMYAEYNRYFVASSVRTNNAKIIDPTGTLAASSSRWEGVAEATIDLDAELFHIDNQYNKLSAIRAVLGDRMTVRTCGEENVFLLSSLDPEWPVARIKKEFSLVSYDEYHRAADVLHRQYTDKGASF